MAYEMATEQLAAGGLSGEDLRLAKLAERDSKNNSRDLKKKIEGDK